MNQRVSIVCEKIKTEDRLLWLNSPKKWKVTATNHTTAPIYLSWNESFVNPYNNQLWIAKIDNTAAAGDRMIVKAENLRCTNFITSGAKENLIPPERFIQIEIQGSQTATWIMERVKRNQWDGFNVYLESLAHTIQNRKQIPTSIETVFPKIKGWPWS